MAYSSLNDEAQGIYLKQGIVAIRGDITQDTMMIATAQLKWLHNTLPIDSTISVIINSGGGSLQAGWSFINEMDIIKVDRIIKTHCDGMAMSMGLQILTNGTKQFRSAFYLSSLMAHYSMGGMPYGTHKDHEDWIKYSLDTHKLLMQYYQGRTGKPLKQLEKDFDKDWFLTPQEALEYGFIDKVEKLNEYQPEFIDKNDQFTIQEWEKLNNNKKSSLRDLIKPTVPTKVK